MAGNSLAETLGVPELDPAPAPAQGRAPDPFDAYRVILQEAGNNPEGMKAVASVIRNRVAKGGTDLNGVLYAQNQFGPGSPRDSLEYRGWQKVANIREDDPRLQAVINATSGIVTGAVPTPYPYTQYYAPGVQAGAGRSKPSWDDGTGVNVGGNLFFTHDVGPPDLASALNVKDELAPREAKIEATPQHPNPGKPSDPQQATANFLTAHGIYNENAPDGSSTHPLMQLADGAVPDKSGTFYIEHGTGALRQVGADGDFMPYYRDLVSRQAVAAAQPAGNRILTGIQGGVDTINASANKLTGGGLAVPGAGDPMAMMATPPQQVRDMALGSMDEQRVQRNAFDLLHQGDPVVGASKFATEAAPAALAAAAVPEITLPGAAAAGVDAGLAGGALRAGGNLLTNAARGAAATAPVVGNSDAPVANQLLGGAVTGAIIPPALKAGAGAIARAVESPLTPAIRDLADTAVNKYNIPLRLSQIKGGGNPLSPEAVRDSNNFGRWGTGVPENHAEQMSAFTRAVAGTFGEDADALTPEVMQRARDRIGSEFDRVAANTAITDTDALQTNLGHIIHDAQMVIPDAEVAPLLRQVENIGSTVSEGRLSGDSYQALTRKGSPLDRAQNSSNPNLRFYAGQMRDALDDALEASATPEDLQALQNARWQYKNLMTVKELAAKAGVEGTISPTLLNGAVNRSFSNRAFSGAGDLGELAQIGQTFLKAPPNSGTAPRLMDEIRNASMGGLGMGTVAGLLSHDPGVGAGVVLSRGGLGTARALKNLLTGAVERSPTARNLLLNPVNVGDTLNQVGDVRGLLALPPSAIGVNRLLFGPEPATASGP